MLPARETCQCGRDCLPSEQRFAVQAMVRASLDLDVDVERDERHRSAFARVEAEQCSSRTSQRRAELATEFVSQPARSR